MNVGQVQPAHPKVDQAIAEIPAERNSCKIFREDYYNPEALEMHYGMDHKTDNGDDSDDDLWISNYYIFTLYCSILYILYYKLILWILYNIT